MGLRGLMAENPPSPHQEMASVPSGDDSNPQSVPGSQIDFTPSRPNLRSRSNLPVVEKHYKIVQKDGTLAIGEVLASRQNSRTKASEFFVHYEGQNRRLDEWLPLDRFLEEATLTTHAAHAVLPTPITAAKNSTATDLKSVSKVTRSARRKFDEINHIQPSLAELLPSQVR